MSAFNLYVPSVLVYLGIDCIACWSLNLQYGITGIFNFAWIVFSAAGAYTVAVLSLGPSSSNGGFQHYILGLGMPVSISLLLGAAVAAALSALIGVLVLRGLQRDVEAIILLVISALATLLANTATAVFNGPAGLALIPQPFAKALQLSASGYSWFFVVLVMCVCVVVYFAIVRPLSYSPVGRVFRGIRDDPKAMEALGRNVFRYRLAAFVIGGALAGLSGGLLATYLTTWAPSAWLYVETFVLFTAVIVGGRGNNLGVMIGAALVPVLFGEVTRFIPTFGHDLLVSSLQWVVIGGLSLTFLWFRPQGVLPERRRRLAEQARTPERGRKVTGLLRTSASPPSDK